MSIEKDKLKIQNDLNAKALDVANKELGQEKAATQALRLRISELEVKITNMGVTDNELNKSNDEIARLKKLNEKANIEIGSLKFDMMKQLEDFKK